MEVVGVEEVARRRALEALERRECAAGPSGAVAVTAVDDTTEVGEAAGVGEVGGTVEVAKRALGVGDGRRVG